MFESAFIIHNEVNRTFVLETIYASFPHTWKVIPYIYVLNIGLPPNGVRAL